MKTPSLHSRSLLTALTLLVLVNSAPALAAKSCNAVLDLTSPTAIAAAQRETVFPEFALSHPLRIDADDLQTFASRKSMLDRLANLFGIDPKQKELDANDPAERVELVARSGQFKTWFASADSIAHDMAQRDGERPALLKPIVNPQEGLLAKLMMIRNAQHTVDLTYYIVESDPAGLSLMNELKDAVKRGVNVRFMVDSLGSLSASMRGNAPIKSLLDYSKRNAGFMTDENGKPTRIKAQVEFVVFNPVTGFEEPPRDLLRATYNVFASAYDRVTGETTERLQSTSWSMNRRSHDKMIVTDALYPKLTIGMVGGRNIADRYFETDPKITDNFVDYETLIRNDPETADKMVATESVGHVMHSFYERLYFHLANRAVTRGLIGRLFGSRYVRKMEKSKDTIATNTAATLERIGEDLHSPDFGKKYLTEGFFDERAQFISTVANIQREGAFRKAEVSDNMQGIENGNSLTDVIQHLFTESARVEQETGVAEEATIVSPYIWLAGRDARLLKKWLLENPKRKLNIITNSIMTTDNLPAQVLVDMSLAESFFNDEGVTNSKGAVVRRSVKDQVTIYAYGRNDAVELGGKTIYAKLHEKGMLLKQANISAVMTYNQDPRAKLLNSESGWVVRGAQSAAVRQAHFDDLIAKSTVYGSDEWKEIRARMTGAKKAVVARESFLYRSMQRLNLWWLI